MERSPGGIYAGSLRNDISCKWRPGVARFGPIFDDRLPRFQPDGRDLARKRANEGPESVRRPLRAPGSGPGRALDIQINRRPFA